MKKILIVEDDRDFIKETADLLSSSGYEAVAVSEGKEAVKKIEEEKPDLIILDLNLKGITGFQVADLLRQSPEAKDIPIIAMTGYFTDEEYSLLINMCGLKECLMKPFEPSVLLETVKKVLNENGGEPA